VNFGLGLILHFLIVIIGHRTSIHAIIFLWLSYLKKSLSQSVKSVTQIIEGSQIQPEAARDFFWLWHFFSETTNVDI
jgi:hypothetical protein